MLVVFASAFLFCLAIAIAQSWLMQLRPQSIYWLWIGMNVAGLAIALAVAVGIAYLLPSIFPLDVLQNSQHAAIVICTMVIISGVIMSLSQWLVLRGRVEAPILRSVANVIVGTSTWFFLRTRVEIFSNATTKTFWLSLVLTVLAGAIVGGLTDRVISLLVRSR
jgi:hypothetical protein